MVKPPVAKKPRTPRPKAKPSTAIVKRIPGQKYLYTFFETHPPPGGIIYAGQSFNYHARCQTRGSGHFDPDSGCKLLKKRIIETVNLGKKPPVAMLVPGLAGGVHEDLADIYECFLIDHFKTHCLVNPRGCNQEPGNHWHRYQDLITVDGKRVVPKTIDEFKELLQAKGLTDEHGEPLGDGIVEAPRSHELANEMELHEQLADQLGNVYMTAEELDTKLVELQKLVSQAEREESYQGHNQLRRIEEMIEEFGKLPQDLEVDGTRATQVVNSIRAMVDPEDKALKSKITQITRLTHTDRQDNVMAGTLVSLLKATENELVANAVAKLDKSEEWVKKALAWKAWSYANHRKKPTHDTRASVHTREEVMLGVEIVNYKQKGCPNLDAVLLVLHFLPWKRFFLSDKLLTQEADVKKLKSMLSAGWGMKKEPFKTHAFQGETTVNFGPYAILRDIRNSGRRTEAEVDEILSHCKDPRSVAYYKNGWLAKNKDKGFQQRKRGIKLTAHYAEMAQKRAAAGVVDHTKSVAHSKVSADDLLDDSDSD